MAKDKKKVKREPLGGHVANIGDLVEYHKGSPVSRSLITTKKGTVTVYAVKKGQSLSEHTSRSHAAVMILEGRAEVAISGKTYKLRKGDGMVLPAGEAHSVQAVKKFKMLLSMVRL